MHFVWGPVLRATFPLKKIHIPAIHPIIKQKRYPPWNESSKFENPWKWVVGVDEFPFGFHPIFRGELAVSFRECIGKKIPSRRIHLSNCFNPLGGFPTHKTRATRATHPTTSRSCNHSTDQWYWTCSLPSRLLKSSWEGRFFWGGKGGWPWLSQVCWAFELENHLFLQDGSQKLSTLRIRKPLNSLASFWGLIHPCEIQVQTLPLEVQMILRAAKTGPNIRLENRFPTNLGTFLKHASIARWNHDWMSGWYWMWFHPLLTLGVQRPLNKWPFRKDHYFSRDL